MFLANDEETPEQFEQFFLPFAMGEKVVQPGLEIISHFVEQRFHFALEVGDRALPTLLATRRRVYSFWCNDAMTSLRPFLQRQLPCQYPLTKSIVAKESLPLKS